jgi:hypothetical protein
LGVPDSDPPAASRAAADGFPLKTTWEKPTRSMSELVPTAGGTPAEVSTDVSLWELGNMFITSAFEVRRALVVCCAP